ncbi:MAG TPA: CDP-glycerol glycerophosphotransferase family protein [Actinomycetes bacterium]|nr:CDP-glycerol glycerophosphotransferase family protein [Actinomycetes bacterium]
MLAKLRQVRGVRVLVRRIGVHRVTMIVGLAQWPMLQLLGVFLPLLPRDPRLVAVGAPLDRFADNAAYLYVHLSEHHDAADMHAVWISGSRSVVSRLRAKGYRAETRWSWQGVRSTLRAGTFIYSGYRSDVNRWLSPGALALCLWHGLPIKRIEADVPTEGTRRRSILDRIAAAGREPAPDYLLSSSEFVTQECFTSAFRVASERCWELGYPRTDHLVHSPKLPPAVTIVQSQQWDELSSADKVVGLFLTWRDDRVDDAVDDTLVTRIAELCGRNGAVMAYKAHYNVAAAAAPADHCVVIPADADLHAYLGLCDVLITDYSSVALDFMMTRRPIVYYMPDVEHYARTRGFYVDPLTLPGTVTLDPEAMLNALEQVLAEPDQNTWGESDEQFRIQMWGRYDGHASQTIVERLRNHLKLTAVDTSHAVDAASTTSQAT